jgi:hypothetical protein
MPSIFTALTPEARRDQRDAYREFVAVRDGAVDVTRRRLARREAKMRDYLTPVSAPRPLDRPLFEAQYASYDPQRTTPPEMLLLLSLVKINAAEAYGVEKMMAPLMARAQREADDLELVLTIEEDYHTRILLSASSLYGLDVSGAYRAHLGLRALIGVLSTVSHTMSRPIVLAAELVGTLYFLDLLRVARDVLKEVPAVRDAVEERLTDVLVDEIGHVSFNRLCLGSLGLTQARMVFPLVAAGLSDAVPELRTLGLRLPTEIDRPLATRPDVPEHVRRQAFFA